MQNQFQRWIFEQIEKQYERKADAISDLSKLLAVGKDAIYRRFRGESVLPPEEIEILAKAYKISLDEYLYDQTSDTVFFTYNNLDKKVLSYESFFNKMEAELIGVSSIPSVNLQYAVPELPIFHIFFSPELTSFKLFTWGRTSWDFDYLQDKKFDFDIIPYPILKQANPIVDLYINIPSTELWGLNLMDFTMNQIEYYVESDVFANDEIPLILCDKLIELLNHMELMAQEGQKFKMEAKLRENGTNFELYHNEMLYTDHTILVSTDLGQAVYTTLGHPDFIKTVDQRITRHMEEWFVKLRSKSTAISTNAEKTRKWYFTRLRKKINALKSRIENFNDLE